MKNINSCLLIAILFLFASCSREKYDWKKIKEQNSQESYEQFINKYPDGKFVDSAKHNIEVLAFDNAILKNTDSTYLEFINSYPYSIYLDTIDLLLEKLYYEIVLNSNSLENHLDFIKKYPNSKYLMKLDSIGVEVKINELPDKYSKNSKLDLTKTPDKNTITSTISYPPNAKIDMGNGMIGIAGAEGVSLSKELAINSYFIFDAEIVTIEQNIPLYLSKETILFSGNTGSIFKRLSDKKIQLMKGTLYLITLK